jgi:hypothetical protein
MLSESFKVIATVGADRVSLRRAPHHLVTRCDCAVVHHHFLLALARLPCLLSVHATPVAYLPSIVVVCCFEENVRPRRDALELDDALQLRDVLQERASTAQLIRTLVTAMSRTCGGGFSDSVRSNPLSVVFPVS